MFNIVALSKENGSSSTIHSSEVTLDSASILKISVSREDIKSFSHVSNDLIIELNDHQKITIKDFFTVVPNGQHNDLVIVDPHDGALWWLENSGTDAAKYTSISFLSEVGTSAVAADEHIGAWVMAGAALLGIGAMFLGASNSHHSDSQASTSNSGGDSPSTPGTSGDDTTAPTESSGIQLSDDGLIVTVRRKLAQPLRSRC